MPMQDPGLDLKCTECQQPLRYISSGSSGGAYAPGDKFNTEVDLHYYECEKHGRFHIGASGQLFRG